MEIVGVVATQTVVMFIYMLVGFVAFKFKKITAGGSKELANVLMWFIMPSVIVRSFCVEPSMEKSLALVSSFLLGAVALLVAMAVSRICFGKFPIEQFGVAFSNAGFIGIPLAEATLGSEAVFYFVGFTAMLGVLQWTYGMAILTHGEHGADLKGVLLNPSTVAMAIGIVLYLTGIGAAIPDVLMTALKGLGSANAPLAMIVLGTYLAQVDLRRMLVQGRLYWASAVRLALIPLATWAVFMVVPGAQEVKTAIFLGASAPVGANVAMFAQLYDLDYPYACQEVVLSTLLSIVTLPLLMLVAA